MKALQTLETYVSGNNDLCQKLELQINFDKGFKVAGYYLFLLISIYWVENEAVLHLKHNA